ncbi:unnamed protein product [Rotaria socialis]
MANLTSTPPPISSNAIDDDKNSGKLIIKAQLGDDIRKMMIHNEDLTLNELVLMMERVFSGKISNSDELTIKYLDDDGDKITLLNDSDLTVALHFHKLLRLFVFVNGNDLTNTNTTDNANKEGDLVDAKTFRHELQQIRNSVQTILDRLQLSTNEVQPPPASKTATPAIATPPVASGTTREFDPYKNVQQQQQHQRPATPDGVQSSSNRLINNEQRASPTVDIKPVDATNMNHTQPSPHMPAPHFMPTVYNNDQQVKTNAFGPPPTSFVGMPPLPTNIAPQYAPPAGNNPNNNAPPTLNSTPTPPPSSMGQPSGFIGQQHQPPPHPQQGGFYGQQQNFFQQRPPVTNFNANNAFAPQQTAPQTSNSTPATINPSYVQPPPMASQQPYGGYAPQNAYYNPVQQYPKTS